MTLNKHKVEGVVTQVLSHGNFQVELKLSDTKVHHLIATTSKKMQDSHIKIVKGDTVLVIMHEHNINAGQIKLRLTNNKRYQQMKDKIKI